MQVHEPLARLGVQESGDQRQLAVLNPGRLQPRIVFQRMDGQITPKPGLLETAKRRGQAQGVNGVDRDGARYQSG